MSHLARPFASLPPVYVHMQLPLYAGQNVMSLMGATALRPDRYTRYRLTSSYHSPVSGDDAPTIVIH